MSIRSSPSLATRHFVKNFYPHPLHSFTRTHPSKYKIISISRPMFKWYKPLQLLKRFQRFRNICFARVETLYIPFHPPSQWTDAREQGRSTLVLFVAIGRHFSSHVSGSIPQNECISIASSSTNILILRSPIVPLTTDCTPFQMICIIPVFTGASPPARGRSQTNKQTNKQKNTKRPECVHFPTWQAPIADPDYFAPVSATPMQHQTIDGPTSPSFPPDYCMCKPVSTYNP